MTRRHRMLPITIALAMLVYTFAAAFGSVAPPTSVRATALPSTNSAAAKPAACVTPPPNMTAWYPFDETGGPISQDIVGGTNGNWLGSPGPMPVPGMVAGGLRFGGSSGYVAAPNAANLNFGTSDFSIDFWVRELNGQTGRRVFIDKRDNTSPALTGWAVGQTNNGRIYIEIGDGSSANTFVATSGPLMNDGNWHFAAYMVSRATPSVTLYLDGAVVGSYSSGLPAGSITSIAPMLMGNIYNISGHQEIVFDGGSLDELELFNRALLVNEVGTIYNAGSYGKCKGQQPSPTPTCPPGQVCATDTPTATPTACGPVGCPTPTPTNCPVPPGCATDTPHPTDTLRLTDTPHPTNTPVVTATPTSCGPVGCPTDTPQTQPSNTPTCIPAQNCATATPRITSTPTATPGCVNPPANLMAWYPLDETVGPISQDIVGGTNGNWLGSPGPMPVPGVVAGGLRFGGSSGYVAAPNAGNLNFGTSDFSIDFWVRELNGQTGRRVFIDKRDNTSPALTGWAVGQTNNGRIYIEMGDGSTANTFVATSGPLMNDGNWHFAAYMVSRATPSVTLYLDGAIVGSYASGLPVGSITSVAPMLLGNIYNINGHQEIVFDGGSLDELELFNRALSVPEVGTIYNAGSNGKCKNGHQPSPTPTPTCIPGTPCNTSTPRITNTPTVTPTSTPPCITPPPNMQAWFPLDETAPATSAEIVGGSNATWVHGPVPVPGKVAGALSFNGVNSFSQRASAPANLNFGTGDFSIDMWVKTVAVPGTTVLLDHRQNISFPYRVGYVVFLYNGKLGFQMEDGTTTATYINFGGPNVGNNIWNLIAVTVQRGSATGLKMYVNGVAVTPSTTSTIPVPGSLSNSFPFRIGGPLPSIYHDRFLRGSLDEIELFGRVLSFNEVSALYNAGSSGKCKPQTPTPTFTPTPCIPGQPCDPTPTNTPTRTPIPTITQIPNGFVDISGNVFANAIGDLYTRGAVSGIDSSHFNPSGTSTRAQFAKVVVIAFSIYDYTPPSPDFTDVQPGYFAYGYIEAGYAFGILNGFDEATCNAAGATFPCYLPNRPITRAQLTKLVVNADGYDLITPPTPTFSDVGPNNIFYSFVETAHAHGVINGYPDGTFRPNNNIRRDEMCQIVYKGVYNF